MHVFMYACTCVYMYVCIHICIYKHRQTDRQTDTHMHLLTCNPHMTRRWSAQVQRDLDVALPALSGIKPEVPAELSDIIAKAVEKRPWRRHADAAAMRLLLEAFRRGG